VSKLRELIDEYNQALQNFEYADEHHVSDAITDLYALEFLIRKEIQKKKRGRR
jgi:hypothetical protein